MRRALFLLIVLGCSQRKEHTIAMRAMSFDPPTLTVKSGDLVVWRNEDIVQHTATATAGLRFDSGPTDPQGTYRVTFSKPGEVDYRCTLHPTMLGKIIVSAD